MSFLIYKTGVNTKTGTWDRVFMLLDVQIFSTIVFFS